VEAIVRLTLGIVSCFTLALFINRTSAQATCSQLFNPQNGVNEAVLAHQIEQSLSTSVEMQKTFGKKARGFAVITAAMVASAAVSTHLTAELPKDMAFLSHLVGQVSTIGIFVLGAPIWEPISSAFRKYAFGLGIEKTELKASDQALEKLWHQTQGRYSLNAQMSRNIIQSFLLSAHQSFGAAREAMLDGREALAIDQIAETAVRLRHLFGEIDPRDASIALAIQSSFTRHVKEPERLEATVMKQIETSDPQASTPEVQTYYRILLHVWLKSRTDQAPQLE
jgi:hypothetical protein